MKNLRSLIAIIFLILPMTLWAQDDDDTQAPPDPKVKEKIQAARIAYLTDQLKLTPDEAEKFWPIYREFSERRQNLKKEYREARRNPDPKKSTEENDKNLLDLQLKLKQQEVDLERDYSGKLLKVISAQKLRELPDAETRFRQMILKQIQRRQMQQDRRDNMRDRSQERLKQRNN